MEKWVQAQKELRTPEEMQRKIDANMKRAKQENWKRQRTPEVRWRFRFEVFKILMLVGTPVLAVYFFNHPYFQDKAQTVMEELEESDKKKAGRVNAAIQVEQFKLEMKERRRSLERAKFLEEQMAFEEAKRERAKRGI